MGRQLRAEQFVEDEVSIVHCVQRCVRRAFLAGVDKDSFIDYRFRGEWIRRRMEALASVFSIDVLVYAILSNHLHVILRNRPDVIARFNDREVAIRWLKVFPGRRLEEHLGEPTENDVDALVRDTERLQEVRRRLCDVSWFMRALSEPIARMANKQDECTGRFWEGRFKAQTIADEAGLLACAMYVDLNPVRAAMAKSPEQSIHTSAYDRIKAEHGQQIDSAAFDLAPAEAAATGEAIRTIPVGLLKQQRREKGRNRTGKRIRRDDWLAPLTMAPNVTAEDPELNRDGVRASDKGFLNIDLADYLRLLRWTGKQAEEGSGGHVPPRLRPVIERLGIDPPMWRDLVWNYRRYFGQSCCAGSPTGMSEYAESTGRNWAKGQRSVSKCFVS